MAAVLIVLAAVLVLVIAASLIGAGPTRVRRRTVIERPVRRRVVEEVVEDRPPRTRRVID